LIGPTTFTVGAPQPAGSGIYAIDGYFALYRLTDTTPPIEPQSMLPVAIGGAATISHGFLWSDDPDNTPAQLTYTIIDQPAHGLILDSGAPATSFTQTDVDNGLVKYVENGDPVKSDSFTFRVSDPAGNSTASETFTIAILDHAGPVVTGGGKLAVPAGGAAPLLNPALDTVSLGNTPDQIAYTLLLPPEHGLILDNGAPATGFTQADIDGHRVQYLVSADGAASDGFIFRVSDAAGAHTAPQFFAIEIGGGVGDLVPSSGGSTGIALQTTNPTFTFEDVSTRIGRADDAVPAGSGLAGEGGSAVQGDTSMSDLLANWALMLPSGGDSQG
jgi:Cadherin-like